MSGEKTHESGHTILELVIAISVIAILFGSVLSLFAALISSSMLAKQKAVALTIATNQMEYLKSLPYDSLGVSGGTIVVTSPIPASKTVTFNSVNYTVVTSINYVDEAYDGCASYPTQALKEQYCRNYPPPSGSPATDTNPQDYKIVHVSVRNGSGTTLAEADTLIGARVAETASTTGALFVTVIDENGNPLSGATVTVTNSTLSPSVNVSDTSDSNGVAIFYGLRPDTTGYDYVISASKTDYSTLTTIAPSGALQPNYPSKQIFSQQSSMVTLPLKPIGTRSLVIETTDTAGSALANVKVYMKGGYKKFTSTTDTAYYFDNMSPSDTRPTTSASGISTVTDLVPGEYFFCGDSGATSCQIGGTTYYLAAAIAYSGANSYRPINIPTYSAASPPSTTFSQDGYEYLQKVRLMLTTDATFPRVFTLTPSELSIASTSLSSFAFTITGTNLPCSSVPASCGTTVALSQGATSFTASCTGTTGTQIDCTSDLSAATAGNITLSITASGKTLNLPDLPLIGGINATP